MEFTFKDSIDSIDTLVERCGVELDVYAWNMIKDHIVKLEETIKEKEDRDLRKFAQSLDN